MAESTGTSIFNKFGPVLLSFLMGSGATGISSYYGLATRVAVVETKTSDFKTELETIKNDVREIRRIVSGK